MKVRRSERLVEMAIYFQQNPNITTPLNYFSEKFQSAKSSISEDLTIIKNSKKKMVVHPIHIAKKIYKKTRIKSLFFYLLISYEPKNL